MTRLLITKIRDGGYTVTECSRNEHLFACTTIVEATKYITKTLTSDSRTEAKA